MVLSKSQQLLLLVIYKKGELKTSEQKIYASDGAFYSTIGYFKDNQLVDVNSIKQAGKKYLHSYYLTQKGLILAKLLTSLDSSEGHFEKYDIIEDVKELVGGDNN